MTDYIRINQITPMPLCHCTRKFKGHLGRFITIFALEVRFHSDTIKDETKCFVSSYFHYLSTTGSEKVAPQFKLAIFSTKPSERLQLHYRELGTSITFDRCVLISQKVTVVMLGTT